MHVRSPSRRRRFALLAAAASAIAAPGCKRGEEVKPPVVGDPVLHCITLPGANRMQLSKSADQKTLYYLEKNLEGKGLDRLFGSSNLFALDVASRTTKLLAEKVDIGATVAPDGRVFFRRKDFAAQSPKGRIHALKPGESAPTPITPEDHDVWAFKIDEASSTLVYATNALPPPGAIYKIPLAGGKAEKIGEGSNVIALIPGEKAALVSLVEGTLARVPLDGGEAKLFQIGSEQSAGGVSKGYVLTKNVTDPKSKYVAVPIGGGAKVDLAIDPAAQDFSGHADGDSYYLTARLPTGVVYRVDGAQVVKVLATKGAKVSSVVSLDKDVLAFLANHDSNGNGTLGDLEDESDVCLVERNGSDKLVDIPTRTVPLAKAPLAQKFEPLLREPDLAGARLSLKTSEDGRDILRFDTPKDGPPDLPALRKRAREIQARVVELAGAPGIDVGVDYANARSAESKWIKSRGRYLSYAGVGTAITAEPSEYDIDLHPVVETDSSDRDFGPAACSGKVKNLGSAPLAAIQATCTNDYLRDLQSTEKGTLTPPTLAPGAEGTFRVRLPRARLDGDFKFSFTSGGKELGYYNSFTSNRSAKIFEAAEKVFAKTGLAYRNNKNEAHLGKPSLIVLVRASEAFDKLGPDEQTKAAEQAAAELGPVLAMKDEDAALPRVLRIVSEGAGGFPTTRIYADGVLRDGGLLAR